MAEEWNAHCNKNAYGEDSGYSDNRERLEFKSGRTIDYLRNSKPKKNHALNFKFDNTKKIDGKTEFEWFLFWYENTVKSGTVPFYFDDIVTHSGQKLYKIKEMSNWGGQAKKEVAITFEEA